MLSDRRLATVERVQGATSDAGALRRPADRRRDVERLVVLEGGTRASTPAAATTASRPTRAGPRMRLGYVSASTGTELAEGVARFAGVLAKAAPM